MVCMISTLMHRGANTSKNFLRPVLWYIYLTTLLMTVASSVRVESDTSMSPNERASLSAWAGRILEGADANQYIRINYESLSFKGGHFLGKQFFEYPRSQPLFLGLSRSRITKSGEFIEVYFPDPIVLLRRKNDCSWPVVLTNEDGLSLCSFHHLTEWLFGFVGSYILHLKHLN